MPTAELAAGWMLPEQTLRVLRNSHMHERKELHICLLAPRCLPTNEWPEVDFTGHGACYHLSAWEDRQRGHSCEVVVSLLSWAVLKSGQKDVYLPIPNRLYRCVLVKDAEIKS